MRKKNKKRYTWNFWNMHPILQITSAIILGSAFWGWIIAGMWFLYIVLTI